MKAFIFRSTYSLKQSEIAIIITFKTMQALDHVLRRTISTQRAAISEYVLAH